MSYILNALKKAETKGFDGENLKIKKQILVLKRQTRGGKLKVVALITVLLGTLLFGWFLGHKQNPQLENQTDFTNKNHISDNKKIVPAINESVSDKKELVAHSIRAEKMLPNDSHRDRVDAKKIPTIKNQNAEINPPIPVRGMMNQVNTPLKEGARQKPVQAEIEPVEEPLQNYSDLPFSIQQKLPPLKISLHFYNSNPTKRLVRINGRILHENDRVEDQLIVEEIKSTTAVLNYAGHLFELNAPGG